MQPSNSFFSLLLNWLIILERKYLFPTDKRTPFYFPLNIRAITSAGVKNFAFYTSKTYFFYFTLLILQNPHISLSIIHLYFNKIFIFFFYYFLHLFSSLPLSLPIRPNHHHPHYPIGEILNSKTIQD